MKEYLWVENYRPKAVKECILPPKIRSTFDGFLKQGEIPNLLLSGTAGTGKTTVAFESLKVHKNEEGLLRYVTPITFPVKDCIRLYNRYPALDWWV